MLRSSPSVRGAATRIMSLFALEHTCVQRRGVPRETSSRLLSEMSGCSDAPAFPHYRRTRSLGKAFAWGPFLSRVRTRFRISPSHSNVRLYVSS